MRKAGKRPQDVPPYIVPLSLQAIEIVRYLLGVMRPAQKYQHQADAPGAVVPPAIPEDVRQRVHRLMNSAVVLEEV